MEMIKVIKKKTNFVGLCLIVSPFLDLLTSIGINEFNSSATIGMFVRTIIVAILALFLLKEKLKNNKKTISYLFVVFVFFCAHILNCYFNKEVFSLFFEVKNFIKIFYFPISLILLVNYLKNKEFNKKYFILCGIIYALMLFLPTIFGFSYDTYSNGKKGSIGLFNSPNEIGAILGMLIPFMLIYIYNYKNKLKSIIMHIICIFTMLLIGTKVPFLAIIVFGVLYLITLIIRKRFYKECLIKKSYIQVAITLIISLVLMVTVSPLGENMKWQLEWFEQNYNEKPNDIDNNHDNIINNSGNNSSNNGTNNDGNSLSNNGINNGENSSLNNETNNGETEIIMNSKLDKLMNLLFSSRNIYVKRYMKIWKSSTLYNKLLGFGYSKSNVLEQNIVEIDYFDVFYNYGIIGFVIYFIPLLLLLIRFGKYIMCKFTEFIKNDDMCAYFISICLSLMIALFAGHLFITPAPSFILAIILSTVYIDINAHMNKI